MNDDNYSDEYRSSDLALVAALVATGFLIEYLERHYSGKATFIFKRNEPLEDAVKDYWADRLKISPRVYFDALKHAKNRLYSDS